MATATLTLTLTLNLLSAIRRVKITVVTQACGLLELTRGSLPTGKLRTSPGLATAKWQRQAATTIIVKCFMATMVGLPFLLGHRLYTILATAVLLAPPTALKRAKGVSLHVNFKLALILLFLTYVC